MVAKTLILALCVIGVTVAEHAPVFLWGFASPPVASLKPLSQSQFESVISKVIDDHMIVVFQEKKLLAKDLACRGQDESECYALLRGVEKKTYLSNVENPVGALIAASSDIEYAKIGAEGELDKEITCTPGKVVVATFDSDAETPSAHDAVIAKVSKELSTCPTAFIYTSTTKPTSSNADASKNRERRDTSSVGNAYREGSKFLIYFTELNIISGSSTEKLTINSMNVENSTNSDTQFSVVLTATNSKSVSFDINTDGYGYYYMTNVAYDGIKFRTLGINAPLEFSYFCGNLTLYNIPSGTPDSASYTLVWNSLQFQAPFGTKDDPQFVFGDSWDCVPFFTPGILMGLFVVILFLFIIFVGICWMVDINTMDRFDDPKGKTITINANE